MRGGAIARTLSAISSGIAGNEFDRRPVESENMPPVIHIVLVTWRRDVPTSALDALTEHVDALASAVPGILSVAHGPSVSPEHLEAGYEWALVITFVDSTARDAYLPHPAHAPVAALLTEWHDGLVVFDLAAPDTPIEEASRAHP